MLASQYPSNSRKNPQISPSRALPQLKGYKRCWLAWMGQRCNRSHGVRSGGRSLRSHPLYRTTTTLQLGRLGRDGFNRLGHWDEPVAMFKAHAIAAQYGATTTRAALNCSQMAYQPLAGNHSTSAMASGRLGRTLRRRLTTYDIADNAGIVSQYLHLLAQSGTSLLFQ